MTPLYLLGPLFCKFLFHSIWSHISRRNICTIFITILVRYGFMMYFLFTILAFLEYVCANQFIVDHLKTSLLPEETLPARLTSVNGPLWSKKYVEKDKGTFWVKLFLLTCLSEKWHLIVHKKIDEFKFHAYKCMSTLIGSQQSNKPLNFEWWLPITSRKNIVFIRVTIV